MPEQGLRRLIYRWRVRVAFIAFLATLILARPTLASLLACIGLSLLGLAVRTWASGHLRKEKTLAVSGPYRYTRNPLYLGNLILGISLVVGAHSWWVFGLFAAYFLVFYPVIIHAERERMLRLFPGKYEEYRRYVPLFFPFRRPFKNGPEASFKWELYRKNKEHRALIGAAVFWLVLGIKLFFGA